MRVVTKWYGPQVKARMDALVSHRLELAALAVEGEIKELMYNEPKTGEWYQVPGTNMMYQASAPGESPAVRTGRLAQSISHMPPFHTGARQWHCFVGTFGEATRAPKILSFIGPMPVTEVGRIALWSGVPTAGMPVFSTIRPTFSFGGSANVSGISGVEGAKYPLYLELGTRHMAPRPYLRRGLDRARPKIKQLFHGVLIPGL